MKLTELYRASHSGEFVRKSAYKGVPFEIIMTLDGDPNESHPATISYNGFPCDCTWVANCTDIASPDYYVGVIEEAFRQATLIIDKMLDDKYSQQSQFGKVINKLEKLGFTEA